MKAKYNNKKTLCDGIMFDSIREAARYRELTLLQRAGVISDLRLQVPFELIARVRLDGRYRPATIYKADFVYMENGAQVVEDSKGYRKIKDYQIKRKLMKAIHGIEVRES